MARRARARSARATASPPQRVRSDRLPLALTLAVFWSDAEGLDDGSVVAAQAAEVADGGMDADDVGGVAETGSNWSEDSAVDVDEQYDSGPRTGEVAAARRPAIPERPPGDLAAQIAQACRVPEVRARLQERRREMEQRALWCRLWLNQCVCVDVSLAMMH